MPNVGDGETIVCGCSETFKSVSGFAEHVAVECPVDGVGYETQPMSDESDVITVKKYAQITGNEYTVVAADNDGDFVLRASLYSGEVEPISGGPKLTNEQREDVLTALVSDLPDTFEHPVTFVKANARAVGGDAGDGGSGGGSGGSTEDESFDGDIFDSRNPTANEYEDDITEAVDDWLSNYASVKSSMIDGAWSTEFGMITDPSNGDSELGVYINIDPWHGPLWDNDKGKFDTDDGKQPDEWADHREAIRSVFTDDDSPVKGVVDDSGEYNEWYNYVPADEVESL